MNRDDFASAEESRRALAVVREGQRFLLVGHASPDGDCLGAQAALAALLEGMGKQVWILNPDPVQPEFDYLARGLKFGVWRGGDLPLHDVAVLLDFCELTRCASLAPALQAASSLKLVVDHHLFHGRPWWDAAWIDPTAAATGLLVHRLARALDVALPLQAALGVFTSLVTDTGWFRYSNTDAESLAVAAELVLAGVQPAQVYAALYQRASRDRPRAIARALDTLEYAAEGRVAVLTLPAGRPGEPALEEGDEVLDLVRAVHTVEVVLLLRESKQGSAKLSVRSKGDFDANALARRFGGGGHRKASGATLSGSLSESRAAVLAAALEELEVGGARRA